MSQCGKSAADGCDVVLAGHPRAARSRDDRHDIVAAEHAGVEVEEVDESGHPVVMADEGDDATDIVRRGYNRLSDLYRSADEEPEEYRQWLDELLRRLEPSSRVLDLGCGNGVPVARRLAHAGHIVTGLDLSDRQIDRARSLVPEATFIRADMTAHDFGVACFDAVVALYSLIHLPLDRQPLVIERIAAGLVGGGVLLATVGWDAWTGADPDWLGGGTDMWWSHADQSTYRLWLEQANFEVESVELVAEGPASGHALIWARRLPCPLPSTAELP